MGNRYTIIERVDAGGMAEVFRGVSESIAGFKKSVAIKCILPSLAKNRQFVSMFLDEAKVSLCLQHANIVQVFDISKSDSSYMLIMEFVDGCNMKALLDHLKAKGKRIEVAHAVYVMIECCKALNYAHHAENLETQTPLDIVHRDVSPPNILVSKMGEVKLVDFGLAKANSQISSTDQGVVKGKFSYLSPEAASGIAVDRRADIFAVGILLWEMLTGRRLFYGETDYKTVELVRQASIPSMVALNSEIKPELEAIVRKALAKNPDERYQEAADLGDALAHFIFDHRMKVTARDVAVVVREVQAERARKRSMGPPNEFINVLIRDEMAKVTSLVEGDAAPLSSHGAGSHSLDPNSFVNTGNWISEFESQPAPLSVPKGSPLPAMAPARDLAVDTSEGSAAHPMATASQPSLHDSLQEILEPDRTGTHEIESSSSSIKIAIVVLLLLAAGLGTVLFLFKDKLFG